MTACEDKLIAVVNLHREGEMSLPSLRSAQAAIEEARRGGVAAEMFLVLDRPDDATCEVVRQFQSAFACHAEEVSYGDLSASRNHAVSGTDGTHLGFLDADDLWSKNWLLASYRLTLAAGPKTICHPHWNLIFGAKQLHFIHPDQSDPQFSLNSLRSENYWTALSFARRETYLAIPYQPNRLAEGFGYEDWNWNCETIAQGYMHRRVPETSHFIRYKKSDSLRDATNSKRCLRTPSSLFQVVQHAR